MLSNGNQLVDGTHQLLSRGPASLRHTLRLLNPLHPFDATLDYMATGHQVTGAGNTGDGYIRAPGDGALMAGEHRGMAISAGCLVFTFLAFAIVCVHLSPLISLYLLPLILAFQRLH